MNGTVFELKQGEYIKEIRQLTDTYDSRWFWENKISLEKVIFVTNTGRKSITYGGWGNSSSERPEYNMKAPDGHRITSLEFESSGFCPPIEGITTTSTIHDNGFHGDPNKNHAFFQMGDPYDFCDSSVKISATEYRCLGHKETSVPIRPAPYGACKVCGMRQGPGAAVCVVCGSPVNEINR